MKTRFKSKRQFEKYHNNLNEKKKVQAVQSHKFDIELIRKELSLRKLK